MNVLIAPGMLVCMIASGFGFQEEKEKHRPPQERIRAPTGKNVFLMFRLAFFNNPRKELL